MSGIALTRQEVMAMTSIHPGEDQAVEPGQPPKAHIWTRVFNTWAGKAAGAVGAAAVVAIVSVLVTLIYQGAQVDHYKAIISVQQAEIASLQQKVDALAASNSDLSGQLAAARKSKSELCNIILSAIGSGQFSPTRAVESPCGTTVPLVVVTRPQPGSKVPAVTEAAGTADVKALKGQTIWFAVSTPGIAGFFIQGYWPTSGGTEITTEGRWTSPGLYVGQAVKDIGKSFDIVVILADQSASGEFWTYLQQSRETGKTPPIGLPTGAKEYTRVNVVRK